MTTRRFEWHRWGATTPGTFAAVPFASGGWRYLVAAETDNVDRSAPGFDDASWSTGTAPFANGVESAHTGLGWPAQGTTIPVSSTLWLRRTVYAPGPGSPVRINVRVDGAVRIYWNGVSIADPGESWSFLNLQGVTIPAEAVEPVNVLAIRYRDDVADPAADYTYADAELTALLPPSTVPYADEVAADAPLAYWRQDDAATATVSVATASSSFGSEPPGNAFDNSPASRWTTAGTATGWLRAQLAAATVLGGYAITRRDDIPARNPTAWTFEGSHDGTTWTVLDTRSAITWPTAGEVKCYPFANTTAFLYYRLNVTANGGDTYLSVADLALGTMEDASGNNRRGRTRGTRTPAPPLTAAGVGAASYAAASGSTVAAGAWADTATMTAEALIICPPASGYRVIVARDNNSTRLWQFRLNPAGRLEALIWLGGLLRSTESPVSLSPGTTYHVALSYDGTTVRMYVDGTLFHQATGSAWAGTLGTGPAPTTVGMDGIAASAFTGVLDEVAVYGTALSAERIAAHAAAVDSTGAPDPAPAPALVDGWVLDEDRSKALQGFTTTIGEPTASVSLQLASDFAPIAPELGERFRITLTADVTAALSLSDDDAPRFTGEVTDAVSDPQARAHTVAGMGRWARHARYPIDARSWPVEDDGARLARILAATRSAADVGTIDAGTAALLPPTDAQPATQLVATVTESTTGQLVEQRDGTLDWQSADHRRGTTPLIELTAAEVFGPGFTWAKRVGDLINDAEVAYGTAGKVRVRDGGSDDTRGPYPASIATALVDESAAYALGSLVVSRRSEPTWQLPAVQVDLLRTILDDTRRNVLAALRPGDRIRVTGLPPSPDAEATTSQDLFVELITEQAWRSAGIADTPSRDNWRLTLTVTDPRVSGVSLRWVDIDDADTWADIGADLTWLDLGRIEDPADLTP